LQGRLAEIVTLQSQFQIQSQLSAVAVEELERQIRKRQREAMVEVMLTFQEVQMFGRVLVEEREPAETVQMELTSAEQAVAELTVEMGDLFQSPYLPQFMEEAEAEEEHRDRMILEVQGPVDRVAVAKAEYKN